jgi:Trk K+ transport system NAD-binding subunit
MSMNKSPDNLRLVYTLFCEDVRFEATNHLSLMGVTHQVVVPRLPVTMIKFAIVNHWRGEGQYLSEVRVLTPDRMQTVAVSQPASFIIPPDGYADNVTVFVNITFFQPGDHVVQTLINSSLFAESTLPIIRIDQPPITHSEHVN